MAKYTEAYAAIQMAATKGSATLRLVIGTDVNAKGKPVELRASVRVESDSPFESIGDVVDALYALGSESVRISLPKIKGSATVTATLSEMLPAESAAILFAHFGNLDYPTDASEDGIDAVLSAVGATRRTVVA
jgi:hypothetical protein